MCDQSKIKINFDVGPNIESGSSTSASVSVNPTSIKGKRNSTQINVGISNCDENREKRTKEALCLWDKIDVGKFVKGLFRPSLLFVREALSCYQNGAFLGATVL